MCWLNCGVTPHTKWPVKQMEVKYGNNTFVLMPRTKENAASIHIDLEGISDDIEGRTLLKRFLSALSWKDDQPAILHYGWSGNTEPTPVPVRMTPDGYQPFKEFPNKICEIKDEKAKLAIALYREALNLEIENIPFSFLSYFKILNIFWEKKLEHELSNYFRNLQDKDLIPIIKAIERKHGDVAKHIVVSRRHAIVHAFLKPTVDPDDVAGVRSISEDLAFMRLLTAKIIEETYNIEQSIWA
jgi:hypothetical protein